MPNKRILLTGPSGFIGTSIIRFWKQQDEIIPCSLRSGFSWESFETNVDCVIHLAGIADQSSAFSAEEYFSVNENLTIEFAKGLKQRGVKHFVFLSSIKVFNEDQLRSGVNEHTEGQPSDAYGQSKWNAEIGLLSLQDEQFVISIIRPPLVFGAGVKGNMKNLVNLLSKKIYLPFEGVSNQRAMVSSRNLVAFLERIVETQLGGVFIPRESALISTTELAKAIRKSLGFQSPRLLRIPDIIRFMIKMLVPGIHKRVFGSQIVDNNYSMQKLNIRNNYDFDTQIDEMVKSLKKN